MQRGRVGPFATHLGVGKGGLGILPHPSCRDHGDIDVHMEAESPLSLNTTKQGGTSGGGRGGTSHVKREKPDCSGLKFSLCTRSQLESPEGTGKELGVSPFHQGVRK